MKLISTLMRPFDISSISQPLPIQNIFAFDSKKLSYYDHQIAYLEEIQTPVVDLDFQGITVTVPSSWHILVVEKETFSIDTIPVISCSVYENFATAFEFSWNNGEVCHKPIDIKVKAIQYREGETIVYPSIPKTSSIFVNLYGTDDMQCGVIIGPYDLSRNVYGRTYGDLYGIN